MGDPDDWRRQATLFAAISPFLPRPQTEASSGAEDVVWLVPRSREDPRLPGLARVRDSELRAASGRTRLHFSATPGDCHFEIESYSGATPDSSFVRIAGRFDPAIEGNLTLEVHPDVGSSQTIHTSTSALRRGLKLIARDLQFDPTTAGWSLRLRLP